MANPPQFIHLRVHTEHSLLEGAVPVKKLVGLCVAQGMPAVAVTDTNNMFAALEFSVTAQGAGVQPILGCQVSRRLRPRRTRARRSAPRRPIVLLAQDEAGYMNLMKLNSLPLPRRRRGQLPQVTMDELAAHAAGLICLTGGPDGPLGRALQARGSTPRQGRCWSVWRRSIRAVSMSSCSATPARADGRPKPNGLTERGFVELAYDMALPLVATNDVYFPKSDMYRGA